MIQLCKKIVEFPMVQKLQGFSRVTRATAVSRLQVPTLQTVHFERCSQNSSWCQEATEITSLNVDPEQDAEKHHAASRAKIDGHIANRGKQHYLRALPQKRSRNVRRRSCKIKTRVKPRFTSKRRKLIQQQGSDREEVT